MNFYIGYESGNGKIEMGANTPYLVRDIQGLEQVQAEKQSIRYVGIAGEKTIIKTPKPRTITIDGRVKGDGRRFFTDKLTKTFDNTEEGYLKLNIWGKLRRIKCMPDTVVFGKLHRSYVDFIITLNCDNPYFTDWENTKVELYTRTGNLINGMTFPRVFTFRTSEGNAINNGDVDIEPIIKITAGAKDGGTGKGITITNETTGAIITLNYEPAEGEEITIDIANREILSNVNGDITRYKSKHTLLGDFKLIKGTNLLKFENANTSQSLVAYADYSNLYIEGVY